MMLQLICYIFAMYNVYYNLVIGALVRLDLGQYTRGWWTLLFSLERSLASAQSHVSFPPEGLDPSLSIKAKTIKSRSDFSILIAS